MHTNSAFINKQRGFTLIELAIVILIIGILFSGLAQGFKIYLTKKRIDVTEKHIEEVSIALANFIKDDSNPNATPPVIDNNVRFPCPADLNIGEGTQGFGAEIACSTMATGTTSGGVWSVTGTGGAGNVIVGAVPTGTLGIPSKYGLDGYGNRLFYAVTRDLTAVDALKSTTRAPSQVGLQVISATGAPINSSVDFAVISPGQSKEGAFSRYGVRNSVCTGTTRADSQNCSWQLGNSAIFRDESAFSLNTASPASYYDDVVNTTLGAVEEDHWWGATQPNTSVDIFNQNNPDSVVVSGTQNRSQLIVNQTGLSGVELEARGAGGSLLLLAADGSASGPSVDFLSGDGSLAGSSRWYLGNPEGDSIDDFFVRYTPVGGVQREVMRLGDGAAQGRVRIGTDTNVPLVNTSGESSMQIASASSNMGYLEVPWILTNGCIEGDARGLTSTAICLGGNETLGTSLNGVTYHDQISMRTSGENRLFINEVGNVGIGTITPVSVLNVHNAIDQGNITISGIGDGAASTGNYSALYLSDNNLDPHTNSWAMMHIKSIGTPRAGDFAIGSYTSSATDNRIIIDAPTHNVGIGTYTPSTELEVNGDVTATNYYYN